MKESGKKKMFHTSSYLGLRTLVFIVLSATLIVCDAQFHATSYLRSIITTILTPIQYLANAPSSLYTATSNLFSLQKKLLAENDDLKKEQLMLKAQLQKLAYLESDNAQLRSLLDVGKHIEGEVFGAQVLDIGVADKNEQKIIIDKGSTNDVVVGQPVLDAYGVMGQIISTNPFASTVLLITDAKSAIPVIDVRNGIRSVVAGTGNAEVLELINVPHTADIKVGDLFVTSGIGFKLPEGYPVGVVKQIENVSSDRFAKVIVTPRANPNRSKYVLIVRPENNNKDTKNPPSEARKLKGKRKHMSE